MLPPAGKSEAERWVARGIRASTFDLIQRLKCIEVDLEIHVLAVEQEDLIAVEKLDVHPIVSQRDRFHFGRTLARFAHETESSGMAYFGGGSAPLLSEKTISESIERIRRSTSPTAVVNNFHSSDWAVFNDIERIRTLADRLPSDNQIGWVFEREGEFQVEGLPPSAGTRSDIDTPVDLLMMSEHPNLGSHLAAFLQAESQDVFKHVEGIRSIMQTPASSLTIIGRTSSHLWSELERNTQIWIRVFVEERGMVASGRMSRGEVRSLVGQILDEWGAETFVEYLSSLSDGVLWDTRVWMAHRGGWPSKSDRFSSDLGRVGEIKDPSLRELSEAVGKATYPILLGGHGVVAGGLYALLESMG